MSSTARTRVENFAERYLELMKQKQTLMEDVKALKEEFKEDGVPVSVVVRVINTIMKEKKKTDTERLEEDAIREWLKENTKVDDAIGIIS